MTKGTAAHERAALAAIARIEARFHPHYGIDGATDSRQLASDCRTLIATIRDHITTPKD